MRQKHAMKLGFIICIFLAGLGLSSTAFAGSAWVWANNPTAKSYTPNVKFAHSQQGGKVWVTRTSPGKYEIKFAGWSVSTRVSSNVQVSAYGVGSNHCKVASWSPSNDTLGVKINCFTSGGTPDDSMFSALISYGNRYDSSSRTAYAWSSSARSSHTAKSKFAYNGQRPVQIKRLKVGVYEANFTGFIGDQANGGNVQVTAYGNSNTQCKIKDWTKRRKDLVITILCFQPAGMPSDSLFSILVHGP
jgi:hypothetical protein